MKSYISYPKFSGVHSKQAHCDLPAGTYEREFGKEGFFGPVSHIHHRHPLTGWIEWEGEHRPRAFDFIQLENQMGGNPWHTERLFFNNSFSVRFWTVTENMSDLVANGDGDELLFIHKGAGSLFCDFGHMSFKEGDYIMLPRALMWRLEVSEPAHILMIEATNDHYKLPDKGLVGPNAIFDPAILEVPEINEEFKAQYSENKTRVYIKRKNKQTIVTYPFNPLDAIGWHGDNLPVKVNWRDIRPLMSHRYHLPPSAHTTFLCNRFVVCTFVPRLIETDAGALKVPFYHSNNDFDEIIFYHQGDFFSRDNIQAGMVTFHPCGFAHGPHPKAFAASMSNPKKETDEVAVMIDTRDATEFSPLLSKVEWSGYINSWKG